jgi:hypothetical protein
LKNSLKPIFVVLTGIHPFALFTIPFFGEVNFLCTLY